MPKGFPYTSNLFLLLTDLPVTTFISNKLSGTLTTTTTTTTMAKTIAPYPCPHHPHPPHAGPYYLCPMKFAFSTLHSLLGKASTGRTLPKIARWHSPIPPSQRFKTILPMFPLFSWSHLPVTFPNVDISLYSSTSCPGEILWNIARGWLFLLRPTIALQPWSCITGPSLGFWVYGHPDDKNVTPPKNYYQVYIVRTWKSMMSYFILNNQCSGIRSPTVNLTRSSFFARLIRNLSRFQTQRFGVASFVWQLLTPTEYEKLATRYWKLDNKEHSFCATAKLVTQFLLIGQ